MLAAHSPKTAWVAKDQLKYKTILAKIPVVPKFKVIHHKYSKQ